LWRTHSAGNDGQNNDRSSSSHLQVGKAHGTVIMMISRRPLDERFSTTTVDDRIVVILIIELCREVVVMDGDLRGGEYRLNIFVRES